MLDSHSRLVADIEAIEQALSGPLENVERADGWTDRSRAAVLDALIRLRRELASGQFGEEADYASRHLVRVLDHLGIARGKVSERIGRLQVALIERRP